MNKEEKPPFRIRFIAKANVKDDDVLRNIKKSAKYPRGKYDVLSKPPCAVVGGGPGVKTRLEEIRAFPGDIYAINDTAGYLSDQGIPCYMFAIDCTTVRYKTGPLVKGAVFASRVNRRQYNMFPKDKIQVFEMAEDASGGITGGPTAACRGAHLMLRMGHTQVVFFGCEACFYDFTHVSGDQKVAFNNMVIIRINGVDYISNSSLILQTQYLVEKMLKFPHLLVNRSGGLLKAMLENPDTWEMVAVGSDLKRKCVRVGGPASFDKRYDFSNRPVWCPPSTVGMEA